MDRYQKPLFAYLASRVGNPPLVKEAAQESFVRAFLKEAAEAGIVLLLAARHRGAGKDYKKAGLIYGGELEEYAKAEFGGFTVAGIVFVGPPLAQTNWVKHGFKVPCQLEITQSEGRKSLYEPSPYVRPGDDETHPDRWNITGGVNLAETQAKMLPNNDLISRHPRSSSQNLRVSWAERTYGCRFNNLE